MFETVMLSSVCSIVKQRPQQFDGYKDYVATADLQKSEIISSTKVTYDNRPSRADSTVNFRDVLVAKMAGAEKTLIAKKEHQNMLFSTGFAILKPLPEVLNSAYLYHFLRSEKFRFQKDRMSSGATQKAITNKALLKIKIPLPPLAEQKRIAGILDKAGHIEQATTSAHKMRFELIRSIFLDMFGDPAVNSKKWEWKSCGEFIDYLADIGSNGANKVISEKLEMSDTEDYAIMIRTTNLTRNDFENNLKYVSKDVYEFFKKSKIYGGEIIMNKIGSAGKFWIMPKLGKPVSLGLNQFVIRLKNINLIYFYHFLSTEFSRVNIDSKLNGVTTKSITKNSVRELPIFVPPLKLQEEFADLVKLINRLNLTGLITYSESLQRSLAQKIFIY